MKFTRTGVTTIIVIAVLAVYAAVMLTNLRGRIGDGQAYNRALEQQIAAETAQNAALRYDVEHSDDPEVIEGIARDKLGMVKPGEKVFIKE